MSMFENAALRSCEHSMKKSISKQKKRTEHAGYRLEVVEEQMRKVAMKMLKRKEEQEEMLEDKKPTVVIEYIHGIGNRLKDIANQFDIKVVFNFPNKLGNLPKGQGKAT